MNFQIGIMPDNAVGGGMVDGMVLPQVAHLVGNVVDVMTEVLESV